MSRCDNSTLVLALKGALAARWTRTDSSQRDQSHLDEEKYWSVDGVWLWI